MERASDAAERTEALATLNLGIERATPVVEQRLTLARQKPEAPKWSPRTPAWPAVMR